jgi:diguanylate cyclase (GGDEF)-like protein
MMTGLANRAQFQTKLPIFCEDHSHAVDAAALLLVDLDGFKIVNDTYGHAAGDDCLQETADRLRNVCRDAALIARLGGDEFAVLFQPGAGKSAIAALADDIVQILRRPMHHADRHLQIGASVGVAFVDGSSPAELYQRADMALYAAKAAGRNTFHIFNPTAPEARANYRPRSAA